MKILSIDGGGMKGLLPALVLADFEVRAGRPLCELCDVIVGTSTGGIIALGLAAGVPARQLADFYLERGPAIFSRSLQKRVTSLGGLADELYDAGELEIALFDVFGDRKLSEVRAGAMVVAYDMEARKPVFLSSLDGREDYRLADLARATSAAPTYFEPYLLRSLSGQQTPCIDGGMVANNPALEAAVSLPGGEAYMLVSLGTGRNVQPILYEAAKSYGAPQWLPHLLDVLFVDQAETVHRLCAGMGGINYVRLQAELPEPVAMDATDRHSLAVLKLAAGRLAESDEAARARAWLGIA